jgi:DNA polymerase-3 subunit gamma/tau
VDVIEIDGASNRGIDEIRTLRENVKYAPARGRYKVYIIDEVHQLTSHAFDALLKTLEEPPAHVVFVLATTDPRDIPATVLSRVQRFDFRPIPPDLLARSLEQILIEEGIPFEPAALPVVVRAAEGSLRDALSVLDTTIAYGQGRLEAATVAALLGTTAPAEIRAFGQALLAREPAAALEAIERAAREGEDLGAFARDAIEVLRRVLVLKAAPSAQLAELAPVEANALRKLGESASLDELLYVLRALMEADALLRESPHPRVELEVAVVRATRRPSPEAIEDVLRRVDDAQARLAQYVPTPAPAAAVQESFLAERPGPGPRPGPTAARPAMAGPAPAASAAPAPASSPTTAATPTTAAAPASAPAPHTTSAPNPTPTPGAAVSGEPNELSTAWQRVVDEVMRKKPMLGAVLAQATPVQVSKGELTIAVAGNHFHRDMLNDRANRDLVLAAVRRWVRDAERFAVAEGPGSGDIAGHPAVQAAITEFEGEVVTVRPRPREGEGQ